MSCQRMTLLLTNTNTDVDVVDVAWKWPTNENSNSQNSLTSPQMWPCRTRTRRASSCTWRRSSRCCPRASPWKPSRRWRRCHGPPPLLSCGWPRSSTTRSRLSSASPSRLHTFLLSFFFFSFSGRLWMEMLHFFRLWTHQLGSPAERKTQWFTLIEVLWCPGKMSATRQQKRKMWRKLLSWQDFSFIYFFFCFFCVCECVRL